MELQETIVVLHLVIISSAADPLKTLTASVGGNFTLPESIQEMGFLSYESKTVAHVQHKKLQEIYEEDFKQRLHWNQNTGYFTLTGLQKNDSGMYTLDSKKGRVVYVNYKLTVYDSVPTPQVRVLNRSSESCSLSCSVDSAQEDVTLLWSKDLKILKKSFSAPSLSLTLFYQQDLNSSLHCVAENPAEKKTVSVHVRTSCQSNTDRLNTNSSTVSRHHLTIVIVPIVACVILLFSACIIWRFHQQKKSTVRQTEDTVYTDVIIVPKDGISQEPSKSEHHNLNTTYDQVAFSPTDS